jgi:hypothetical protein
MRAALVALFSSLVLLAAGCGSGSAGAGADSPATMLKPGALVYWETETDPDSDQWNQVEELLGRFPDGDKWVAELRKSFEGDTGVTWDEIEGALGPRLGVAVYARSIADVSFVGLMKPDDPDETIALVERLNRQEPEDPVVAREVDGWVALSDKPASIDAALKGEDDALADGEQFQDGMERLPDDALSRVYVDVSAALDAFGTADPRVRQSVRLLGLDQLDFVGAWAKARDDGVELAGSLTGEAADRLLGAGDNYSSKLLDLVPAEAFAFASLQGEGVSGQFEGLQGNPLFGMALRDFEQETGIRFDDLVRILKGEAAFYAAPGAPIPELTLLLDSDDASRDRQAVDRLLRTLAQRSCARVTEDGDVTTAVFEGFTVNVGSADGTIVVTTNKDAIADLADGAGDKLKDSDRFGDALDAAGAPDEYTGLFYVDLAQTIEVVMGFASSSGQSVPAEISRNLEPLRSVVAYGEKDGDSGTSLVFVEIQ